MEPKPGRDHLSERLSHLPQEVLGELDGLVQGQIQTAIADVLLDPAREFSTLVRASVTLRNATSVVTPTLSRQCGTRSLSHTLSAKIMSP